MSPLRGFCAILGGFVLGYSTGVHGTVQAVLLSCAGAALILVGRLERKKRGL